ncbi:MAG: tyrosine--tRNA ligase, partial [Clostridia bacterium]|nr:tyrosine--tRNA ligase [Clostridia bacterium]
IRMLTFLPIEQINAMDSWEGAQLNEAKEILAYELTEMVHGKDEADKAKEASKALFGAGASDENMPTTEITAEQLSDSAIGIMDLLIACGLTPSKSEARRLIQGGGVFVDDEKVSDVYMSIPADKLADGIKIRKGKKTFHRAILG